MENRIAALVLVAGMFAIHPASAQGNAKPDLAHSLIGTWRLTGISALDLETKAVSFPIGMHPAGYIQYSPGGHVVVFFSAGEVPKFKPPYSEADKAALFDRLSGAYAGTYTVQDNKVIHHLIASYRPETVGTDLTRFVELKGNKLTLTTAPQLSKFTGKKVVDTVTLVREE